MTKPTLSRPRGRPRSEATRRAILAATLRQLRRQSVQSVTIEGIAHEAGVSKATIYRWWPSKLALVIDAFVEHHIASVPIHNETKAVKALTDHLILLTEQYSGEHGSLVAQIIAAGQDDASVLDKFRERFANERSASVTRVVEAGKARGELRKDVSTETISECLYAPIYFRLMITGRPLDRAFAENHARAVLGLLKAPGARSLTRRRQSPQRAGSKSNRRATAPAK